MADLGFTRKTNPDGSVNPKYVDLLEEDKPISGQKFVCIICISRKHISSKKSFLFPRIPKTL